MKIAVIGEKAPRNVPLKRGHIYCSPACGRGCTLNEYEAASKTAMWMVGVLGEGWIPNVWENLGWHCSAVYTTPKGGELMSARYDKGYWRIQYRHTSTIVEDQNHQVCLRSIRRDLLGELEALAIDLLHIDKGTPGP